MKPAALNPITEDDIAQFLVHTPDFIDRHANIPAAGLAGKMVWLEKRP